MKAVLTEEVSFEQGLRGRKEMNQGIREGKGILGRGQTD
jgi:hypothetical protein